MTPRDGTIAIRTKKTKTGIETRKGAAGVTSAQVKMRLTTTRTTIITMAIIISDHSESESVTEVASGIGRWSRNGMPPCVFGILAYSTFHFPHFVGFKNFLKQGIYLHVI